ncbi:hypothetical protein SAMN05444360_101280 [Chryseobacterium carnipullorum]|uniref:hypothetical protein n=1 Tax=Chryseobacterium carnipullorum TaxID=1124835 RepID=UPI000923B189|nr:hypothetical protein [Chryseobacterium carnipullorum]SHL36502.1 hypothetical protein SAMN05444360_101280 [Chryseobacterium carnipullorum]
MSKIKLLIHEVFKQAREESDKDTKNGLASYLWLYFKEDLGFEITDKSFARYYDAYILGGKEIQIQSDRLDKMSEYVGFRNFSDFSRTFVKNDESSNKTTVKISVDKDEETLTEKLSNIIINITNEQHFKMPDFMKQNGLGIMEMALLLCLVTGNVVFSNSKKISNGSSFPSSFMSGLQAGTDKKYMYWGGERYIATDSSFIRPGLEVKAMNEHVFLHFRKIKRKDTLTEANALGKTWYSKFYGNVEFFTDDGVDPENGRELRKSTSTIIYKYAGKPKDSVEVEE